jgi:hypothetical protein
MSAASAAAKVHSPRGGLDHRHDAGTHRRGEALPRWLIGNRSAYGPTGADMKNPDSQRGGTHLLELFTNFWADRRKPSGASSSCSINLGLTGRSPASIEAGETGSSWDFHRSIKA